MANQDDKHCNCFNRRDLMIGAFATMASSVSATALAQTRSFIDVHHHFTPPGQRPGPTDWSPQIAIEEMDRNGVATGIGFLGPIRSENDNDRARRIARDWNEFGARLCRDHGTRFGLFAALPLPDVQGSLVEIEYAFDALRADGLGIVTNYGDLWLGNPRFDPIWEEANRRKAVVFVHPINAPCCTPANLSYQTPPVDQPWIEWPMNTARTILSLMLSGTLRKFRDIRFIFCHGGGVMPLLVGRLSGFSASAVTGREAFTAGIESEFRTLFFECAQAYTQTNISALTSLVPPTQIMFGTDYNRFPIGHSVKQFETLLLDATTTRAIARDTAVKLFPRFQ